MHQEPVADLVLPGSLLQEAPAPEDVGVGARGSGALGIEALSRGAASATFVENDRRALEALRRNLESLALLDRSTVVAGDGTDAVAAGADVVLLDPPYDFDAWPALLAEVCGATVVIESDREIALPDDFGTYRVRRYGGTVVTLAAAPRCPEEIER